MASIALGAVITVAAVIAGLAVFTANHHARPVTHVKLAATAAPLTSTLAQDAGSATKSISAELTQAAKAVKARAAAAGGRARARQAKARATKARAARERAARIHKRREPTHTHTTPSSSPSVATTASTYTQTTPAPSAPAESSNPSTATTSHQTAHPYGDGGLLGAGSSPSG